jgi:hypothetical protein
MNVPLLDLKAHHQPLRKELLAALEQVLDKNNFILGNEVAELEEKIAAYCQVRFGVGVSSGTDALLVALMALDIKSGDEVITTPLSFFATVGVIVRLGARPVFVDIDGPSSLSTCTVSAPIWTRFLRSPHDAGWRWWKMLRKLSAPSIEPADGQAVWVSPGVSPFSRAKIWGVWGTVAWL